METEILFICEIVKSNYESYGSLELRRLFHGRGRTYQGYQFLSIDLFPPALLVTLYEERDVLWKEALAEQLMKLVGVDIIVCQNRKKVPWENIVLRGTLLEDHVIQENGLNYSISLSRGENPGIFPDMRDGRKYIKEISSGKRVLNLFSYTCAFSVAALEGGACSVLNMDMNSNSLSRGRLNHQLNDHGKVNIQFFNHNILKSFGKIVKKGPYDLVIIDPPPSQGSSFNLERDYGRVLRKTKDFLSDEGEIFACLNSHQYDFPWFEEFLEKQLGDFRIIKKMGAGDDFPEKEADFGLKIIHLALQG